MSRPTGPKFGVAFVRRPSTAGEPPKPADGPPKPSAGPPKPTTVEVRPTMAPRRQVTPKPTRPRGAPATGDAAATLAAKERVPMRIARGELAGKMKCRIWKKLHPESAKRFSQAYDFLSKHPELSLAEAVSAAESEMPIDQFLARHKTKEDKRRVAAARTEIPQAPIDAFLQGFIDRGEELAFVLGKPVRRGRLSAVKPTLFILEGDERLRKIDVVLLTTAKHWATIASTLPRNSELAARPQPVPLEPSQRQVHDARPMLAAVGQQIQVALRNGLVVADELQAAGPYDVLLGRGETTLLVPLHAMLSWNVATPPAPPAAVP